MVCGFVAFCRVYLECLVFNRDGNIGEGKGALRMGIGKFGSNLKMVQILYSVPSFDRSQRLPRVSGFMR